ncbi:MAG: aminotransferase [Acidiferrobacteraceae bacterium]|nr:aminotransferase [Acidiferrobacteraceae bacterium]
MNYLSESELIRLQSDLAVRLKRAKDRGYQLNISRGNPSPEQLDLANPMLSLPGPSDYISKDNIDCRSYGIVDGLFEMKQLFAGILECPVENIIIGGNSSLTMMHDALFRAYQWGASASTIPWRKQGTIRFLCPSPGYDRHFSITELFGFEMLPVEMTQDGPNMDQVEALCLDSSVKGIWCVPRYSNPTGITYSHEVINRLAQMETANDFRIFWDNAYAEHHLILEPDPLENILDACIKNGNEDRVLMFASTSKMSLAGAGVAAIGASSANIQDARTKIGVQTIGPDKINQLRHMIFFEDLDGLRNHMHKHARILKPKFDLVEEILQRELGEKNIAKWSKPKGGYFISLDVPNGCARRVIAMTEEAGVTLTPAGASFPHGLDPNDCNIRIAPTFPSMEDLGRAIELLAICTQLVAINKYLGKTDN